MSGFFTFPASQRKRKRQDAVAPASKKRQIAPKNHEATQKDEDDESVSDNGSSASGSPAASISGSDSEENGATETAAERRLKLAEQYLENIRAEVGRDDGQEIGFDAEDVDRKLIAARLREDVAEEKGRLHRFIAGDLDIHQATQSFFGADTLSTCGIAVCPPFVYTVSKDIRVIKWKLAEPNAGSSHRPSGNIQVNGHKKGRLPRRKPTQVLYTSGNKNFANDATHQHHTAAILCVAASADGKFVATGGVDRRLIVWNAATLKPLKIFSQHRDSIMALAFRGKTNQLFSASKDRTVKIWSLDELAYVETLFGHQDEVVDIAAIGGTNERCVSVGARDRTARLWKVVEESQLVFRGGGTGGASSRRDHKDRGRAELTKGCNSTSLLDDEDAAPVFNEGSLDRVTQIDTQLFVTGSDSGALSLYKLDRKKALHVYPAAHGFDPAPKAAESSADVHDDMLGLLALNAEASPNKYNAQPTPRWITALKAIPFSDLFLTGSWDGYVRVWRITGTDAAGSQRRIEPVGVLGIAVQLPLEPLLSPHDTVMKANDADNDEEEFASAASSPTSSTASGILSPAPIKGVINDIALFLRGDRGQDGVCVVAGVGNEMRLGRWKKAKGRKNGGAVWEIGFKK